MADDPPDDPPTPVDQLRDVLQTPEDVTLPPEMAGTPDPAPHGDTDGWPGDDRPPPDPPAEDDDPTPPLQRAAAEPLNDYGNGRRFQIHFGRDVKHVPRLGWFVWTGKLWQPDPDELLTRALAHRIGALIEMETQYLKVPAEEEAMRDRRDELTVEIGRLSDIPKRGAEDRTALREAKAARAALDETLDQIGGQIGKRLTHAKAAGNTNSLTNMLTEAAVGLACAVELLDSEPMAINTESGILRFKVSADPDSGMSRVAEVTLHPHDRAALMTKIMPVRYNPAAPAPTFHRFLERIQPDGTMRGFLQRWFGLSMTGRAVQYLCFFYGDGNNGKSVLIDLMCRIWGSYATTVDIKSLTGENQRDGAAATPDLVPLLGARAVRSSEPKRGEAWQEETIKKLTGGEPIRMRPLFGASIEAAVFFKLTITGNDRPAILGQDEGIWRRIRIVPFEVQIPPEELIEKEDFDPMLYAERDGVFAWAVQGLLDYMEGGLQEPELVLHTTQEFRNESDPCGTFLDEVCLVTGDPEHRIWTADLVNAFHFWMAMGKKGAWKDQTVSRAFADHARKWRSKRTGQKFTAHKSGGYQGYLGIQFQPVFKRQFDDAHRDHTGRPIVKRPPTEADET